MKTAFGFGKLFGAFLFIFTGSFVINAAVAQTATDLKCNGCVGKRDVGKKAITSKHIKDGKVKAKDLNKNAKPAAGAYAANHAAAGGTTLPSTATSLRAATLNAPGPGAIIAYGNVTAQVVTPGTSLIHCKLSETVSDINGLEDLWQAAALTSPAAGTISSVQMFPVAAAGNITIHYVCKATGSIKTYVAQIALQFVPDAQSNVVEAASGSEAAGSELLSK